MRNFVLKPSACRVRVLNSHEIQKISSFCLPAVCKVVKGHLHSPSIFIDHTCCTLAASMLIEAISLL